MRVKSARLVLLFLLVLPVTGAVAEEPDGEFAAWAENVNLVLFGGPPPGDLEILINGEFVAEVTDAPLPLAEIADLLKPGVNVLEVRMTTPAEPRGPANRMKIQVAPIRKLSSTQRQSGQPLAEIEVPPELDSGKLDCSQATKFWAGPSATSAELKDDYYLVLNGPPIHHWATVEINGTPVYGANVGNAMFEITDFVVKGKNELILKFVPSCMNRPSGRKDDFQVVVATGELEVDVVQLGQPLVLLTHSRDKKQGQEFQRKASFRAR